MPAFTQGNCSSRARQFDHMGVFVRVCVCEGVACLHLHTEYGSDLTDSWLPMCGCLDTSCEIHLVNLLFQPRSWSTLAVLWLPDQVATVEEMNGSDQRELKPRDWKGARICYTLMGILARELMSLQTIRNYKRKRSCHAVANVKEMVTNCC